MADGNEEKRRCVTGTSRWTKNRAKNRLLTDDELCTLLPTFQHEIIQGGSELPLPSVVPPATSNFPADDVARHQQNYEVFLS